MSVDRTSTRSSPLRTIVTIVLWIIVAGTVGFVVGTVAFMCAESVMWIVLAIVVMAGVGGLVGRISRKSSMLAPVVAGLASLVLAVILVAWWTAKSLIIHGGRPPAPGEDAHTQIGWSTPLFWYWFSSGAAWAAACVLLYVLGLLIGRRSPTR